MNKPTSETYLEFQTAYDFFNRVLFNNTIPDCLITYQRKANSKGYFADGQFLNAKTKKIIDELAMNPDFFISGQDKDILSTLVHEMVHAWQRHNGKPGRGRYHNKEWAEKMVSIGLQPRAIGTKDGVTGDRVTHSIILGGKFDLACEKLIAELKITWMNRYAALTLEEGEDQEEEIPKKKVQKKKIKYTCACGKNVWGKPKLNILCADCQTVFESDEDIIEKISK
jgi:predicted SprT family Zn-dependent metalloprotease